MVCGDAVQMSNVPLIKGGAVVRRLIAVLPLALRQPDGQREQEHKHKQRGCSRYC